MTTTIGLTLADLFPPADLAAAIQAGHVTRKQHPELPLSIYTYTRECQYGHIWTPVTMQCRGLIADDVTGAVVALPFPKIFVTGMHGVHDFAPALPAEPFEVFEKADGSLAIVYHYAGRWHAASKGSFTSEQAQWAQARLDAADPSRLDPQVTYLAEAIYPGNRIVVDYDDLQELVLLAAYRTATGEEVSLADAAPQWAPIGRPVRSWGLSDDVAHLDRLAADGRDLTGHVRAGTDSEGYVIRFASGLRAKIKLANYLSLHRLFTGTNERSIWEVLASGQDPAVLFDQVPDEFADWAHAIADRLRAQHEQLLAEAREHFANVIGSLPQGFDRKAFALALAAANSPHRAALFMLLDGNDTELAGWAWKQIRPRGDQPFKTDDEG